MGFAFSFYLIAGLESPRNTLRADPLPLDASENSMTRQQSKGNASSRANNDATDRSRFDS
jgi:hypothetical protein